MKAKIIEFPQKPGTLKRHGPGEWTVYIPGFGWSKVTTYHKAVAMRRKIFKVDAFKLEEK